MRPSVDELDEESVELLRGAFEGLMQRQDADGYLSIAGLYGSPGGFAQVNSLTFLPWNRAYLWRLEGALRAIEPDAFLPWWDWASAEARTHGIPAAYAAREVAGRPNPLFDCQVPSDAAARLVDAPDRTYREPASPESLPGVADTENVLVIVDFESFSRRLELLHNTIHGWVGGTNGMVSLAAYDPLFWAYQANVDRIWSEWQRLHPEVGPPSRIADSPLAPLELSVADVWEPSRLGTRYVSAPIRTAGTAVGAANDLPAAAGELGFGDYADAFAELIRSPYTEPPLTVGIFGSWGMGKSSLLKMIAARIPEPTPRPKVGLRGASRQLLRWAGRKLTHRARRSSPEETTAAPSDEPGEVDVHVVRFNAWAYDSSDRIWPSLVRQIMESMEEVRWPPGRRYLATVKRNVRRDLRRFNGGLGIVLVVLAAVLVGVAAVGGASAALGTLGAFGLVGLAKLAADVRSHPVSRWVGRLVDPPVYGEELPYMREIRADLAFLVDQLEAAPSDRSAEGQSGGGPQRVLVMVDDLDRCEPGKAVEVLRAINLLLDFEVFVVCLGIDARIVGAAIESHYRRLLGSAGASGYEYLDKIVQIPFRIPPANPDEVRAFIGSQMPLQAPEEVVEGNGDFDVDAVSELQEVDFGGAQDGGDRPAPGEAGSEPATDDTARLAGFTLDEVKGFQLLAPFVDRNPRHIKRLVNVYRVVRALAERRGIGLIGEKPQLAFTWIVICAQWPYTVGAMLASFDEILERIASGLDRDYPDASPLFELYRRAKPEISGAAQLRFDGDIANLEKIVARTELEWGELEAMHRYTINFNPAIGEVLRGRAAGGDGDDDHA